jgi:hypothetical protein
MFNEGLPQWLDLFTVKPLHVTDVKTGCSNFRGISILLISYKIVSNILRQVNFVNGRIIDITNENIVVIGQLFIFGGYDTENGSLMG